MFSLQGINAESKPQTQTGRPEHKVRGALKVQDMAAREASPAESGSQFVPSSAFVRHTKTRIFLQSNPSILQTFKFIRFFFSFANCCCEIWFNFKTTLHLQGQIARLMTLNCSMKECVIDASVSLTRQQSDVMVISLFSTPENGILIQDFFPIDSAYFSKFSLSQPPLIMISSLFINSQQLAIYHEPYLKVVSFCSLGLLGVQVPFFYLVKKVSILTISPQSSKSTTN